MRESKQTKDLRCGAFLWANDWANLMMLLSMAGESSVLTMKCKGCLLETLTVPRQEIMLHEARGSVCTFVLCTYLSVFLASDLFKLE